MKATAAIIRAGDGRVAATPADAQSFARSFSDSAAIRAAADGDCALCTIVGIEGSFSRQLGAQLAIRRDGTVVGSLADGCLEAQLVDEVRRIDRPVVRHYGRGSGQIDFRLPCGSAIHILIDPAPERQAVTRVVRDLSERRASSLDLAPAVAGGQNLLQRRHYIPDLQIIALGTGPELVALSHLAAAAGVEVHACDPDSRLIALGREPDLSPPDRWTAVILLFHDHEWERDALIWALRSEAFYIGAQGGAVAHQRRLATLRDCGICPEDLGRIICPVGLFAKARQPGTLALSALAEIVFRYGLLEIGK